MIKFHELIFFQVTMKVKTRFAPSPTGSMHIGGLRTALYAYAYANKHNGEFVLRLEDTDRKRFVPGSIDFVVDTLRQFKLPADKMPTKESIAKAEVDGNKDMSEPDWILKEAELNALNDSDFETVCIQSQRIKLYQKYALKLVESGNAYICFASAEELQNLRDKADASKTRFIYRGQLGKYNLQDALPRIRSGEHFVVRLNVAKYVAEKNVDKVEHDGTVYPLSEVDDQVLVKSDGIATYHLAVVVDDHLMGITHPMRASEWIPSTPKQVVIYDMLGWDMPKFIHLTSILNANGKGKLSKRDGSVSTLEFLQEGYLAEAMLNFLMLLGWSSPEKHEHGVKEREFYTLTEFVDLFDVKDLNKSNPIFNRDKLLWFNQKYISNLEVTELAKRYLEWLDSYGNDPELRKRIVELGEEYLKNVLVLVKERVRLLAEISDSIRLFYYREEINDEKWLSQFNGLVNARDLVQEFFGVLSSKNSIQNWEHEDWEKTIRSLADKFEIKARDAFMLVRMAVLRKSVSPPLYESMVVLGDVECKKRIEAFLA